MLFDFKYAGAGVGFGPQRVCSLHDFVVVTEIALQKRSTGIVDLKFVK